MRPFGSPGRLRSAPCAPRPLRRSPPRRRSGGRAAATAQRSTRREPLGQRILPKSDRDRGAAAGGGRRLRLRRHRPVRLLPVQDGQDREEGRLLRQRLRRPVQEGHRRDRQGEGGRQGRGPEGDRPHQGAAGVRRLAQDPGRQGEGLRLPHRDPERVRPAPGRLGLRGHLRRREVVPGHLTVRGAGGDQETGPGHRPAQGRRADQRHPVDVARGATWRCSSSTREACPA